MTTPAQASRSTLVTALVGLVLVAAIWGSTFPISKDLLTRMPVTDYLAVRFALAAGVLVLLNPLALRRADHRQVGAGIVLGLVYGVGQWLQFEGLNRSSVTVSAFIVSMYVVFAPLMAATVLKVRIPPKTLAAVLVATTGVMCMSLRGWVFGFGEAITLVSSAMYAVHILAMARLSRPGHAYVLTIVQLGTIAAVFTVPSLPGGIAVPHGTDWWRMAYLAIAAGALAILVQTWAQARVASSQAAVVMVTEPVWASLFAVLIWHEVLDLRTILGAGLVLLAAFIVLVNPRRREPVVEWSPEPDPPDPGLPDPDLPGERPRALEPLSPEE